MLEEAIITGARIDKDRNRTTLLVKVVIADHLLKHFESPDFGLI